MYCYSPSSEVYSTFFLTYLSTADVFILPESKIRDVGIKAKFAPLDKDFVSSLGDTEIGIAGSDTRPDVLRDKRFR